MIKEKRVGNPLTNPKEFGLVKIAMAEAELTSDKPVLIYGNQELLNNFYQFFNNEAYGVSRLMSARTRNVIGAATKFLESLPIKPNDLNVDTRVFASYRTDHLRKRAVKKALEQGNELWRTFSELGLIRSSFSRGEALIPELRDKVAHFEFSPILPNSAESSRKTLR